MIILEEDDECTPLKGDSTTPVSPTSPSQLSSPDSPPSYNEAVICGPPSRHPSYDAIPIPEQLDMESLDRTVPDKRRRRRNRRKVHMMLLFLALTGCIVFWLTFAIFFQPRGLARNPPPGPPPDRKGGKHHGPPSEEDGSRGPPDGDDGSRGDGPPPGDVDEGVSPHQLDIISTGRPISL
ncbi:uncharacterized protein EV420DRAFT_313856 [Desarmillaria tabescens]|uniref:Uncharacterized protein n=1 Tax=Armillaria tabescens TaxID=1929756 RepID=A0AA39KDQ5_ARMTA|nr:uncharacterized protein EV420DRAFT_313856 [Desarmillaria tabescens]KAK0459292.1 hypothetical protein EV420DRAFT_313856 [Desarmillaria tabescens]